MFEENKQLCRRLYHEGWNKGKTDAVDEIVASNCRFHDAAFPSLGAGPKNYKQHILDCRKAFPDLRFNIDDVIAEGKEVVLHWTARGTHSGTFLGAEATQRTVTITGTSISRIERGKLTEIWVDWNVQALLDQLGLGNGQAEANKNLVRRMVDEIWNHKKSRMIDQYIAADCRHMTPGGLLIGGKGFRKQYDTFLNAFPDCHVEINELCCEGDRVMMRYTATGTHDGELMGMSGTGKRVSVPGMALLRLKDGKVVEGHDLWDTLSLAQQVSATTLVSQTFAR